MEGGWRLRSFLIMPAVCNVRTEHVLLPLPVLRMPEQRSITHCPLMSTTTACSYTSILSLLYSHYLPMLPGDLTHR